MRLRLPLAGRGPGRPGRVRAGGVAGVLLALLAVSGCAGIHPGAAATVGGTTITQAKVDDVAAALCSASVASAQARGQQGAVATEDQRVNALNVLIQSEIARQFGDTEDVAPDQSMVSKAIQQNQASLDALPADQRADFRSALRRYAEGQLVLLQLGRRSLTDQGTKKPGDQQALSEGERLEGRFVDDLDIDIDPRYGSFDQGEVKAGNPSLSVATSQVARAAAQSKKSTAYLATLPVSQKCS